jgi:hypothetical protein
MQQGAAEIIGQEVSSVNVVRRQSATSMIVASWIAQPLV